MGYQLTAANMNVLLEQLGKDYQIFAPKVFQGEGRFADTDLIRYGEVKAIEEIEFDAKSHYSFKEALTPVSETLFYYTEEQTAVPQLTPRGTLIFLRSCDIHALRRQDEIYLRNGFEDFYYKRQRDRIKLILIGCDSSFENCFCVDMGCNQTDQYDAAVRFTDGYVYIDCRDEQIEKLTEPLSEKQLPVVPHFVTDNQVHVNIPSDLDLSVMNSKMWDEYDSRCIACGRCTFVCPTCTCFTMQDIFYKENGKAGERRRVWSSCHVDGYTDVAGGMSYRKKNGQRMRFKVLHKIYDFNKRYGYHMCTGCGRCDDICPEYISYSACINKLECAMKEVK